ncbi:hypothetical protein MMC13_002443 [Lambiella insularis]|nr:hypothetical protein [Lambiella insularis]
MSFLKTPPMLRSLLIQYPKTNGLRSAFPAQRRLYAQSYGGGEGDPKGENPQKQGSNPATSDLEHPGPPPPDVGQGTGGGPTKAGSSGDGKGTQQHGGASSDSGSDSGSSGSTKSKSGASPAIHKENMPAEESEEVKKHNKELEGRHDRASNKVDHDGRDNVGKKYWSGHGGADRNP